METLKTKVDKPSIGRSKLGVGSVMRGMTEDPTEEDFARFKALSDASLESFRALVQFAQGALRTSLLINGGATVALLSFFAATISSSFPPSIILKQALFIYGLGIFLGALASGLGYAQAYSNYNDNKQQAKWFFISCFVLILLSYITFIIGGIFSYLGLPHVQP